MPVPDMNGLRYDNKADWNVIRSCQKTSHDNMTQKDGLSSKYLTWCKTKLHIEKNIS